MAADANGQVWRTRAAVLLRAQEALDDPVLERVEADHREPSSRPQQVEGRGERRLDRAELVVDGDPQRLEDALRRVAVAEARRRGNRGLDRVDELAGPLERLLAAAASDRPRDLPRVALLAVLLEDRGQVALALLVHELARRELRVRVHAHVERRVDRVREAALREVDLHARDAEVEQHCVGAHAVRGQLLEHDRELAAQEAALHRGALAEPLEVRARSRVPVDRDQLALAAQVGRQQLGVSAGAESRIHHRVARAHGERLPHLLCEDGNVVSRVGSQDVRQHPPHSLPSP